MMSHRASIHTLQDTVTTGRGALVDGVPEAGGEAERVAAQAVDLVAPTEALRSDPRLTEGFKSAFGQHPAGIAIITAAGPEGPVGLTASSVSSISADPPILGFSLQAKRGSAAVVASADSFIVHFLDSDNVELARSFAISGAPRFGEDMAWETLPTGEPRLTGVRRVLPGEVALTRAFWLLRPAEDRRSDRLNRLAEAVGTAIRREVARLETIAAGADCGSHEAGA